MAYTQDNDIIALDIEYHPIIAGAHPVCAQRRIVQFFRILDRRLRQMLQRVFQPGYYRFIKSSDIPAGSARIYQAVRHVLSAEDIPMAFNTAVAVVGPGFFDAG